MKHEDFNRLANELGAVCVYQTSPCAVFKSPTGMVVSVDFESELELLNTPDLTTVDTLVGCSLATGNKPPATKMDLEGAPRDN